MDKIEDICEKLACEAAIFKVKNSGISDYTNNLYMACQRHIPEDMVGISLEKFACYTTNWNAFKCGIGEKAQLQLLKEKFNSIKKLPNRGKDAISLYRDTDNSIIIKKSKSNIVGIKTFDAFYECDEDITFCILKSVDLSTFSNSKGGGHQDNVRNEIIQTIKLVNDKKFSYKNKSVKIRIFISGKGADAIILHCKKILHNSIYLTIDSL